MRQQVDVAGREEVGLALHPEALVELLASGCRRPPARGGSASRSPARVGSRLASTKRRSASGCSASTSSMMPAFAGYTRPGCCRIRRDDQHAHAELAQQVVQAPPLRDGERAVDAAPRPPARARVRVGAALHAEERRVAHQHPARRRPPSRARHAGREARGVEAARVLEARLGPRAVERGRGCRPGGRCRCGASPPKGSLLLAPIVPRFQLSTPVRMRGMQCSKRARSRVITLATSPKSESFTAAIASSRPSTRIERRLRAEDLVALVGDAPACVDANRTRPAPAKGAGRPGSTSSRRSPPASRASAR